PVDQTPNPEPPPPVTTPATPGPPGQIHQGNPPAVAASGNGHRRRPPVLSAASDPQRAKLRRLGTRLGRLDRDLMQRIAVLADERLHALVKNAGNKLRSAAQGRPLVWQQVRDLDVLHVPRQLGPSGAHALGLDDHALVQTAAAGFARKALPWIATGQDQVLQSVADGTDQDPDTLDEATAGDRSTWLQTAEGLLVTGFTAQAMAYLYQPDGQIQQGEVSDILAPRSAIRDALAVAGGADPGNSGPRLGLGGGPMATDTLAEGGAMVDGYRWVYTDQARTTFPGHLQLDGIEFAGWDDDQLVTQPEDDWIGDFYAPGDHDGCGCAVEQVLVPMADLSEDGGSMNGELVGAEG
ncbi:MAG: hypothetical protein ABR532_06440, partial [Candidatus Dormibacteria bacterium]